MNKMREVANTMIDTTKKDVMSTINTAFDMLVVPVNAQLPENIFIEYFLDFFRNYNTGDLNEPLNLKWIELSGSVYNEVDILNAEGDVIYTVPPLMARADLDGKPIEDFNFSKMVGEYNLRSNRLQTDAQNFLNNQLNGLDTQISSDHIPSIAARWNQVFSRYATNTVLPDQIKLTVEPNNADTYIDYD